MFNSNGVFLQQVIHYRFLITRTLCRNANIYMTDVTSGQFLFCDGRFVTGLQLPVLEKTINPTTSMSGLGRSSP